MSKKKRSGAVAIKPEGSWRNVWGHRELYLMLLPGLITCVVVRISARWVFSATAREV